MRFLPILLLATALPAFGDIGIFTPGRGNGNGSGSITNLSPHAGAIASSTLATVTAGTSAKNYTNFTTAVATNVITSIAGTNGFIQVTNSGIYQVDISATYRSSGTAQRTNVFGVATNAATVGLTSAGISFTTQSSYASNWVAGSASSFIYLPSNTVVTLTYRQTAGADNDLAIENAYLSVALVGGTTIGSGSGGGSGDVTAAASFSNDERLIRSDGTGKGVQASPVTVNDSGSVAGVSNLTVNAAADIAGAQTNRSTVGIAGAVTHTGTMRGHGAYTNLAGVTVDGANFVSRDGADYLIAGALQGGIDSSLSSVAISPHISTPGSINLSGITVSRALMADANGMVTNVTSADPSNEYVKADGTTGVPSAGEGSPGGNSSDIQFNQSTAFAGTNMFQFDRTNNRVAIAMAGARPNEAMEIGGATPKIRLGGSGTGETNVMDSRGIGNITSGAFEIRNNGSVITYFDNLGDDAGVYPVTDNSKNLGSSAAAWKTNYSYVLQAYTRVTTPVVDGLNYTSNKVFGLPGSGSTVTLWGTNQVWKMHQTSNVTFATDSLLSNVVYRITWTNNASTITWPALSTLKWVDVAGQVAAPSLQGGEYTLEIILTDHGTTAKVVAGPEPPNNHLSGTGGALTNFTLFATGGDMTASAATNVNIVAVTNYVAGVPLYWTFLATNGSGSDRNIYFPPVINRYRFSGVYGTNAPSVITNGTQILVSGRSDGTNTLIGYTYFAWP